MLSTDGGLHMNGSLLVSRVSVVAWTPQPLPVGSHNLWVLSRFFLSLCSHFDKAV